MRNALNNASRTILGRDLACGLSFDFNNMFRPNQAPVVNVVAAVLVLGSAIPIYFAQRLSGSTNQGLTGAR